MSNLHEQNNLRQVVTFQAECHGFAVEVYKRAAEAGLIHPDEMILAGHTWGQLKNAQTVQLQPPGVEAPEEKEQAPDADHP